MALVAHTRKRAEMAPNYSPTYNILGYAYRQQGNYTAAEQAFKKYIELIPNDPNPYDSYAELLLKMGRFDDSVAQYHKALSDRSSFSALAFRIAADVMYAGQSRRRRSRAAENGRSARATTANCAPHISAWPSWPPMAASADKALQAMDKEYAVAEKNKRCYVDGRRSSGQRQHSRPDSELR